MDNSEFYKEIGRKESFSKTISETDVYLFSGITGDMNPIHINKEYAEKTRFKNRIVHGMLTASLVSTVLATKLPGPGSIFVSQESEFKNPVFIGDTITAIVEVKQYDSENHRIVLKTYCKNQKNITVMEGTATLIPPPGHVEIQDN